jgi:hypothetical protein
MNDVYDEAVYYFHQYPEEIPKAWATPSYHDYGFLFDFLTPSRRYEIYLDHARGYGCASQVAAGMNYAYTSELTQFCRAQDISPNFHTLVPSEQVEYLEKFAIVQREADRLLNRPIPVLNGGKDE